MLLSWGQPSAPGGGGPPLVRGLPPKLGSEVSIGLRLRRLCSEESTGEKVTSLMQRWASVTSDSTLGCPWNILRGRPGWVVSCGISYGNCESSDDQNLRDGVQQ